LEKAAVAVGTIGEVKRKRGLENAIQVGTYRKEKKMQEGQHAVD